MSDVIDKTKNFIVENFLFGEAGDLSEDTSFLNAGIIDSTGMLELVSFLEETFSIKVNDDELVPENLDSLNNISKFVATKLG